MSLATPSKTPLGQPVPGEPASALVVRHRLTHDLVRHYDALRALRNRKELHKSALYAEIRDELSRILDGVEVGVRAPPESADVEPAAGPKKPLRVVAWNIQRGRYFDGLVAAFKEDPTLRDADLLLLSEVDCGMGRSGNRHVAAELAQALGLHYAFAVSYLVLGDDFLENEGGVPNTLALAGSAMLSRYPFGRVENVDLPELKDKFSSRREKRLGKKRALLAEILLPDGPLVVAGCHLDSNASPRQRAQQLEPLLERAQKLAETAADGSRRQSVRILLGGDLNSTTYDASGALALFADLLHKFIFTGFNNVVDGYMKPELGYDRPLFEVLARHGYTVEGFNERSRGTYHYDVMSPYAVQKLYSKVGRWATHWLQRRLRPWNGVVPARLDWFAGKGLRPVGCAVIEASRPPRDGQPVSDHWPISVDIEV
jgi:endonuclease/exonuclease/phosphatase family metal-dependent hydrolase